MPSSSTYSKTNLVLFSLILLFFLVFSDASKAANEINTGGFSLGSTRVIYDEAKNQASITVINTAKASPFLAQSWLEPYSHSPDTKNISAKAPFMVTPPLYRQDEGKNTLRIVRTGGELPSDRESVFWLNVKAIPSAPKSLQDKNSVQFAYVLRVKMFYRPQNIVGDASQAYKALSFSHQNDQLIATNPTAYYVTFAELKVGGKDVKDYSIMVPPFGSASYSMPQVKTGNKVIFKTINDYGGLYPERVVTF